MAYLLDSNIFIQAKNEYYGFDLCPGFWAWLKQQNEIGTVWSIVPVKEELVRGADELAQWVRDEGNMLFKPMDSTASNAMVEVSNWVQQGDYRSDAKRSFLSCADPFLIAFAKAHDYVVVSHETLVGSGRKRVKIPAVCQALDVSYMRTFEMLRAEEASFVLS
ncbi:MAG: DUF4411 family protein [Cyanobacteria bacterium P01_A01_bin.116]